MKQMLAWALMRSGSRWKTGAISICQNGVLQRNLGEQQFRDRLAAIFFSAKPAHEENPPDEKLDRQAPVAAAGDRDLVSH